MPTPFPLPALHPPVRERWSVDAGASYVGARPVSDGEILAVAAHDHLLGLDARTGAMRWRHPQRLPISVLVAVDGGPVIAVPEDLDVELVAYDWSGALRWRVLSGIGIGGEGLRGAGRELIAIGLPVGEWGQQFCQVRDAATGTVTLQFPCNGDVPDRVAQGFVTAIADEPGGLFLHDPATTTKTRRLLDRSGFVRTIADGIVVVDTYDGDSRHSRLVAVDLATERVLWDEDGGPSLALAAADGEIACCVGVDDEHLAMTLRELRTGRRIWTAPPIEARGVSALLAADCVIASITSERIEFYDRKTGELVQSLAQASSLVGGGCLTPAGFVDIASPRVVCLGDARLGDPAATSAPHRA